MSTMGRRKNLLSKIKDHRTRHVTFTTRKFSIIKKAYELSVLCDCKVGIIMFDSNKRLYQYASTDMDQILFEYLNYPEPNESLTNVDVIEQLNTKDHKLSVSSQDSRLSKFTNNIGMHETKYISQPARQIIATPKIKPKHKEITAKEFKLLMTDGYEYEKEPSVDKDFEFIPVSELSKEMENKQSNSVLRDSTVIDLAMSDESEIYSDTNDDFDDIDDNCIQENIKKLINSSTSLQPSNRPNFSTKSNENEEIMQNNLVKTYYLPVNQNQQNTYVHPSNEEIKVESDDSIQLINDSDDDEYNRKVRMCTSPIVSNLTPLVSNVHSVVARGENKPKDQFEHVRYRPYNILRSSKKIVKPSIKVQNVHESSNYVQQIQAGKEVSKSPPLQQHEDYGPESEQRL